MDGHKRTFICGVRKKRRDATDERQQADEEQESPSEPPHCFSSSSSLSHSCSRCFSAHLRLVLTVLSPSISGTGSIGSNAVSSSPVCGLRRSVWSQSCCAVPSPGDVIQVCVCVWYVCLCEDPCVSSSSHFRLAGFVCRLLKTVMSSEV